MRDLVPAQRRAVPMLITSADPYKLRKLLTREHRRRAILVRSDIHEVTEGVWGAEVLRLKPIRGAWVRPTAISAGVVGGLAGAAAAGWWLLAVTAAAVEGVSAAAVVGGAVVLLLLVLLVRSRGGARPTAGGSDCTTTVRITHRHHHH